MDKIIKRYKMKLAFLALVAKAEIVVYEDESVCFANIKMDHLIPRESVAVLSIFKGALANKQYFEKIKGKKK